MEDTQEKSQNKFAVELARKFHNYYESLAPSFGYETREDTKEFNPKSNNGKLMVEVCELIIKDLVLPPKKTN